MSELLSPFRQFAYWTVAVDVAMAGIPGLAAAQPSLGGAESFAVLSGVSVTVAGASLFSGDVGADAGGTVVGVTPAMLAPGSVLHVGDAVAAQAHHDAVTAYSYVASRTCIGLNNLTGQTLGVGPAASLVPGVYCFTGDAR